MRIFAVLTVLAAMSQPLMARETTVKIGEVQAAGSKVEFNVNDKDGTKAAHFFASDRYNTKIIMLIMSKAQLEQMKLLIDATIQELDASPAK